MIEPASLTVFGPGKYTLLYYTSSNVKIEIPFTRPLLTTISGPDCTLLALECDETTFSISIDSEGLRNFYVSTRVITREKLK